MPVSSSGSGLAIVMPSAGAVGPSASVPAVFAPSVPSGGASSSGSALAVVVPSVPSVAVVSPSVPAAPAGSVVSSGASNVAGMPLNISGVQSVQQALPVVAPSASVSAGSVAADPSMVPSPVDTGSGPSLTWQSFQDFFTQHGVNIVSVMEYGGVGAVVLYAAHWTWRKVRKRGADAYRK